MVAWTVDEAGLYLSTFKQYEYRPPDLIKERVDNDYDSILRSSLTNISRVNKTDVETPKTSLGSFANIANTPADRLHALPGLGQVKVRKIKDAFEQRIRNNATSSLSSQSRPILDTRLSIAVAPTNTNRNNVPVLPDSQTPQDLELGIDLDVDTVTDIGSGPLPVSRSTDAPNLMNRSPSPAWDIELDLNGSDEEDENVNVSLDMNVTDGFGAATLL